MPETNNSLFWEARKLSSLRIQIARKFLE